MGVRQVFVKEAWRNGVPEGEHLFVIDDEGRLWERFSDQPPGEWSEIPPPATKPVTP